jgi:hypothetical protein
MVKKNILLVFFILGFYFVSAGCSNCGDGLFNLCDKQECLGLGECGFSGFLFGSCYDITCREGEKRCDGNSIQGCSNGKFNKISTCSKNEVCTNGACYTAKIVDKCQILNESFSYYKLSNDILVKNISFVHSLDNALVSCFKITGDNIAFDGNGHQIIFEDSNILESSISGIIYLNGERVFSDSNFIWTNELAFNLDFNSANSFCENLNYAGYDDWTLPSGSGDYAGLSLLHDGYFPTFWSSQYETNSNVGHLVYFNSGNNFDVASHQDNEKFPVHCVRQIDKTKTISPTGFLFESEKNKTKISNISLQNVETRDFNYGIYSINASNLKIEDVVSGGKIRSFFSQNSTLYFFNLNFGDSYMEDSYAYFINNSFSQFKTINLSKVHINFVFSNGLISFSSIFNQVFNRSDASRIQSAIQIYPTNFSVNTTLAPELANKSAVVYLNGLGLPVSSPCRIENAPPYGSSEDVANFYGVASIYEDNNLVEDKKSILEGNTDSDKNCLYDTPVKFNIPHFSEYSFAVCGNGVLETGETCDTPYGAGEMCCDSRRASYALDWDVNCPSFNCVCPSDDLQSDWSGATDSGEGQKAYFWSVKNYTKLIGNKCYNYTACEKSYLDAYCIDEESGNIYPAEHSALESDQIDSNLCYSGHCEVADENQDTWAYHTLADGTEIYGVYGKYIHGETYLTDPINCLHMVPKSRCEFSVSDLNCNVVGECNIISPLNNSYESSSEIHNCIIGNSSQCSRLGLGTCYICDECRRNNNLPVSNNPPLNPSFSRGELEIVPTLYHESTKAADVNCSGIFYAPKAGAYNINYKLYDQNNNIISDGGSESITVSVDICGQIIPYNVSKLFSNVLKNDSKSFRCKFNLTADSFERVMSSGFLFDIDRDGYRTIKQAENIDFSNEAYDCDDWPFDDSNKDSSFKCLEYNSLDYSSNIISDIYSKRPSCLSDSNSNNILDYASCAYCKFPRTFNKAINLYVTNISNSSQKILLEDNKFFTWQNIYGVVNLTGGCLYPEYNDSTTFNETVYLDIYNPSFDSRNSAFDANRTRSICGLDSNGHSYSNCTINATCFKRDSLKVSCSFILPGSYTYLQDNIIFNFSNISRYRVSSDNINLGSCPYDSVCKNGGTGWMPTYTPVSNSMIAAEVLTFSPPSPTSSLLLSPGNLFINGAEPFSSCEKLEVCNTKLDKYIDESENNCSNIINEINYKDCLIKYVINVGLGDMNKYVLANGSTLSAGKWMQGYWWNELNYNSFPNRLSSCESSGEHAYLNSRRDLFNKLDLSALGLLKHTSSSWTSSQQTSQNSCLLSELKTLDNLDYLKTGICADYTVTFYSLARKIGFAKGEVYMSSAPKHIYNLIKSPTNNNFTIVDTTGNVARILDYNKASLNILKSSYPYCAIHYLIDEFGYKDYSDFISDNNNYVNFALCGGNLAKVKYDGRSTMSMSQYLHLNFGNGLSTIFCFSNEQVISLDSEPLGCCRSPSVRLLSRDGDSSKCCPSGSSVAWNVDGSIRSTNNNQFNNGCCTAPNQLVWGAIGSVYAQGGSKATSICCSPSESFYSYSSDGEILRCNDLNNINAVTTYDADIQSDQVKFACIKPLTPITTDYASGYKCCSPGAGLEVKKDGSVGDCCESPKKLYYGTGVYAQGGSKENSLCCYPQSGGAAPTITYDSDGAIYTCAD